MAAMSENTLNDLLTRMVGKEVSIYLDNGQVISGKLGPSADYSSANAKVVHIEEISGKDLYDAVIAKDKISAVTYRRA